MQVNSSRSPLARYEIEFAEMRLKHGLLSENRNPQAWPRRSGTSVSVCSGDTHWKVGPDMHPNTLRAALRSAGRRRLGGFLAAAVLLCLFFRLGGIWRAELIATLGERAFLWISGVGMFAVILVPPIIVEHAIQRDRRLYCPQCGKFLATIPAMLRLNKHGDCVFCGADLGIEKPTRSQILADLVLCFGSLVLLMLFMRLIFR